jgi:Protein of unknown function (DUF1203)
MFGWELIEGRVLEGAIERLFANPGDAYLQIRYAAPGCYAARVERASGRPDFFIGYRRRIGETRSMLRLLPLFRPVDVPQLSPQAKAED